MKRSLTYITACDLGANIASIWRAKTKRGMDPDAIEAMLHEITVTLTKYKLRVRRQMFQRFYRTSNN